MVKTAEADVGMNVVNLKKMKREPEKELLESLQFIDQLAAIVTQQPRVVAKTGEAVQIRVLFD